MLFVDTKRFQPVIYENDLPHEKDLYHVPPRHVPESEKQFERFVAERGIITDDEYWDRQYYYCINGYTVENAVIDGGDTFIDGEDVIKIDENTRYIPYLDLKIYNNAIHISGRMYFYLNFWKIKRKEEGSKLKKVGAPRFTDLSWENWEVRELMTRRQRDNLWTKSRQKGFSEEEACNLAYDFLFIPESQGVIVAGEEKYNLNTFRFVKRGLKHLLNTQFYKILERNSEDYILSKYTGSEIYSRTAKDNPEVLSGLSPSKVLFEEIGIWKKGLVLDTLSYLRASMEAEGEKTGYIQLTGTGGEIEDSIEDMEELFDEPEKNGILSFPNRYSRDKTADVKTAHFVPAWKFRLVDEEGNSLKEKSIEDLLMSREKKSLKARYIATSQYPIYPEEIFSLNSGGFFGQEITQLLTERYIYITTHRECQIERKGYLEWKVKGKPWEGVRFVDDPDGWFTMIEPPEVDEITGKAFKNLYLGCTDSYDQDEAVYSTSKGAMHIRKKFNGRDKHWETYVAQIFERPTAATGGAELFYEHTAMACIFYGCVNLIEWSNPRIFDWYVNNGFQPLLMERPKMATANMIKNSQLSNRYGADKSLKPISLGILRDKLNKEFIDRLFIKQQIFKLAKFIYDPSGKKYNCDITVSTAYGELAAKEYEFVSVIKEQENDNKLKGMYAFVNQNGVIKRIAV